LQAQELSFKSIMHVY